MVEDLPFGNQTFDAAMAMLTLHHWTILTGGLAELRRAASRPAVRTTGFLAVLAG